MVGIAFIALVLNVLAVIFYKAEGDGRLGGPIAYIGYIVLNVIACACSIYAIIVVWNFKHSG